MRVRKEAEIAQCRHHADSFIGAVSERDLTMFALALYAGEGSKTGGSLVFANSDPVLMRILWIGSAPRSQSTNRGSG